LPHWSPPKPFIPSGNADSASFDETYATSQISTLRSHTKRWLYPLETLPENTALLSTDMDALRWQLIASRFARPRQQPFNLLSDATDATDSLIEGFSAWRSAQQQASTERRRRGRPT
jgi:hypothetical protein